MATEALELDIISHAEFEKLEHLRNIRNPIAHFREYGHPQRLETRAVQTLSRCSGDALLPEEVVANDSADAIKLAFHFLARFCIPESFERFVLLARNQNTS